MKPLFFVTCVPRCGSQWLTQLLDTAPGVKVYHSNYLVGGKKIILRTDIESMIDAWHAKDQCSYLRESRERVARFAERDAPGMRGWGEVNEHLRYSVPWLREVFDVPIIGLIRDGYQTIPSLVRHHFYNPGKTQEWTSAIIPHSGTVWEAWHEMTPFARCCWLWADSYQRLLDQKVPIFRLECLNAEFGNVERLYDVLGISRGYKCWQDWKVERTGKPVDDFYRGRPRPALPPDRLETFNRWAGDVQEYFYG